MWIASLNYHKDGDFVEVEQTKLRYVALEHLGDNLFGLINKLTPEWTYNVRWGPKDNYGIAEKSIGHKLYELGQWAGLGFGSWNKRTSLARIPVTEEFIRANFSPRYHPSWRDR